MSPAVHMRPHSPGITPVVAQGGQYAALLPAGLLLSKRGRCRSRAQASQR